MLKMLNKCLTSIEWVRTIAGKCDGVTRNQMSVPFLSETVCREGQKQIIKKVNFNNFLIPSSNFILNLIIHHHQSFKFNSLLDLSDSAIFQSRTPSNNILFSQFKSNLTTQNRFWLSSKKSGKNSDKVTIINRFIRQISLLAQKQQYREIIKLMNNKKAKKLTIQDIQILRTIYFQHINLNNEIVDFVSLVIFCSIQQRNIASMKKNGYEEKEIEDFLYKHVYGYLKGKRNIDLAGRIGYNFKKRSWLFALCKDSYLTLAKKQGSGSHHGGRQQLVYFYMMKENGVIKFILKKNDKVTNKKLTKH